MLVGNISPAAVNPLPHTLCKFLTSYLLACQSFLGQHAFYYHLGGDTGMIFPGEP